MYLKRPLTYLFLFLIAFGGFFGDITLTTKTQNNTTISSIDLAYKSNITYAEESKKPDDASVKAMEKYNGMIDVLNIALGVLNVIVSPVILFAGWLLSPDWTSGDLFGLREPMYRLWVVVSNIVYFVYAILLILIALGTMFNQDKFSYKVMLPKLALGIILVPFTWWFVQWTISISSVITASVMSIPTETMDAIAATHPSKWYSDTPSIPIEITIGSGATKAEECTESTCITPKKFLAGSAGTYGPMVIYGYSIFKFQKIQALDTKLDIAAAALKIVHTSIVSTIMFAVFGILTMALISMLIVRAVKLWMYAIFSPLFTFRFVAGSNLMGGDDSFSIKEFVGLAFVPAIVGLTLSFGLIMIAAVQSTNGDGSVASKTKPCILTDGCTIMNLMGSPKNSIFRKWELSKAGLDGTDGSDYKTTTTFNWGDIKVNFLGNAVNQKNIDSSTQGTIDAAGGIFGTLIIDVIALVFIWMAFMAAKGVSKAVAFAVEPFEAIGKSVGDMAKSIPKYTPIPGLGISMSGVKDGISKIDQSYKDTRKNEDARSPLGQMMGLEPAMRAETKKALENIASNNRDSLRDGSMAAQAMIQIRQESKGNKAEASADALNKILDKFSDKGNDGKVTKFDESGLRNNLQSMGINPNLYMSDLMTKYKTGAIQKEYLQNDSKGSAIYKQMTERSDGTTPAKSTTTPQTGSAPVSITINNTTVETIAAELKGKGVTKDQLVEALKDKPILKDSADKILALIKKLETSGGSGSQH